MRFSLSATSLTLALCLSGCDQLAPLFKKEPTREEQFVLKLSQGEAAAQAGNYDEAIAHYKAAAAFTVSNTTPTKALGEIYARLGDHRQALLSFRQVLVHTPGDLEVQKMLAEIYLLDGNDEAAAKQLRSLVNASIGQPDIALVRKLCSALLRSGQVEEARPLVERIEAAAPGDADTMAVQAELLLADGAEDGAVLLLDQAVRANPSSLYVRLTRARYFLDRDNAEAAAGELSAAASLAPGDPQIAFLHARALFDLERLSEAGALLEDLLRSRPADLRLQGILAEIKLAEENPAEAISLAESILASSPNDPQALFVRARAIELSNPNTSMPAIGAYRQIVKIHPNHVQALHRLWKLLVTVGEKTEAVTALERLLTLEKITPEEEIELAALYAETALNLPRAKRLIEAALKGDPGDPRLIEISAKIRARMKEVPPRSSRQGSGIQIIKGGR